MATQQRSVIITAIVLAIIVGGALTWLLNRTPADQLATQAPPINAPDTATAEDLVPVADEETSGLFLEDGSQLAQADLPDRQAGEQAQEQQNQNQVSPVQSEGEAPAGAGQAQGVSVSAPTGPAHIAIFIGAGLTGLLGLARVTWLRG